MGGLSPQYAGGRPLLRGIAAVGNRYLELRIVTSAIEEWLNVNAPMLAGIGDFGDRYFGTERRAA